MDPTKFQELAVQLKSFQTPRHNRAAIGRSYYAAFHVAASLLRANGFPIKNNHTAHDEVYRHLSWSDDEEVARAGSQLNDMRGVRNKADYQLENPETEADACAALWVQVGAHCIERLRNSFAGERRVQIIEGIKLTRKKAYGY